MSDPNRNARLNAVAHAIFEVWGERDQFATLSMRYAAAQRALDALDLLGEPTTEQKDGN